MPGRSKNAVVRATKRSDLAASRARAREDSVPAEVIAACREVIRAVRAGAHVDHACRARGFHAGVFWDTLARVKSLPDEYAAALRGRGMVHGEGFVRIADDALLDPIAFYTDQHGVRRIDPGYVQLQKLRAQLRLADAERLMPSLYAPPSTAADRGPVEVTVVVQRFIETPPEGERIPSQQQREREQA
jgi:hypothetical protein